MKVAYIGATMDLPHAGHINIIKHAKEIADFVVVSLNRDEFVSRFKRKPILTLEERMAIVSEWKDVDKVVVNTGDEDSKPMLLKWQPDYVVFGSDYDLERYKKQIGVTEEFLKEHNIELVQVPYTQTISTSEIIRRCKTGE